MDSISQAVWGALSAEAAPTGKSKLRIKPWFIGLIGGTLPDLDSFFSSSSDPLFATLMHRHFTHSILFIPVGALLCWLLFWPFFRKDRSDYLAYYKISFFAYGTHWLLDLMTSYGTQIFWPFTSRRFSLDWLSIVDPLLTIPWLIAFMLIAFSFRKRLILKIIFTFSFCYFSWAATQEYRAERATHQIATSKGHTPERIRVLPSLGNSFWFRSIYLFEGQIYAQGILVNPTGKVQMQAGELTTWLSLDSIKSQNPQIARQVQIWSWFTDDWMYSLNPEMTILGDGRYSAVANGFQTLWALHLNQEQPELSRKKMPSFENPLSERNPFEGFQKLFDSNDLIALP